MKKKRKSIAEARETGEPDVRIIGGTFRGRKLRYHGDPIVRPMKHRTREAIFNLVSTECAGRHAIDLFAGTGALGLEALSRGAATATFIEKHVPSARAVEENIHTLGVENRATLCVTSAFLWAKRDMANVGADCVAAGKSWLIFCSPPYAFYHDRQMEMLELIERIQEHAPGGSILIVEADESFDLELVRGNTLIKDRGGNWDVRVYAPAVVGVWRKLGRTLQM
ncbi:MAG TPA: RsmD family RNA methyltransferase [Lacipirellulaceae bacterium]|nr:RsmD family RNA methyltransferase [Lacipirellulaceae bacterium]